MKFKIGFQFFAQGGDVVNTSVGYVNAYTGATTQFDRDFTFAPTLKTYYDKRLLQNARRKAIYGRFAEPLSLPAHGGKNMEKRRFNTFARATQLQEGVIPTGQKFGMSSIYGNIADYGTYTAISDRLVLHAIDPIIRGATEEMGASAGDTQEQLLVDALLTNTNVMKCDNVDYDTRAFKSKPTTAFNTMGASSTDGYALLTPKMVLRAVTAMKKNKVPTINGKYVCVIHPSVAEDLRNDPQWIDFHKHNATDELFRDSIGELHGMVFLENVDSPVLKGTYANKSGGAVYASFVFGKGGFGHIDPEGGGMEMIVKPREVAGGPLNQWSTVGYKFEDGVMILYTERVLTIFSTSSYSDVDDEN